jgi:hypothetical protein
MGPWNVTDETLFAALRRVQEYRAAHPDVIIAGPTETFSGLWEVSLQGRACMAFDSIEGMLDALDDIG